MAKRKVRIEFDSKDWPIALKVSEIPPLVAFGLCEDLTESNSKKYLDIARSDVSTGLLEVKSLMMGTPALASLQGNNINLLLCKPDAIKRHLWNRHRIRVSIEIKNNF